MYSHGDCLNRNQAIAKVDCSASLPSTVLDVPSGFQGLVTLGEAGQLRIILVSLHALSIHVQLFCELCLEIVTED